MLQTDNSPNTLSNQVGKKKLEKRNYFISLTFSRSKGCVIHAAPALANPPKYHLAIRFCSDILKKKFDFKSCFMKQP